MVLYGWLSLLPFWQWHYTLYPHMTSYNWSIMHLRCCIWCFKNTKIFSFTLQYGRHGMCSWDMVLQNSKYHMKTHADVCWIDLICFYTYRCINVKNFFLRLSSTWMKVSAIKFIEFILEQSKGCFYWHG